MRSVIRYLTIFLAFAARRLPEAWVARLGVALGWGWHSIIPIRRALVRRQMRARLNLAAAESAALTRSMYRHLGLSIVELFRHGTQEGGRPKLRVEGEPHLLMPWPKAVAWSL